MGRHRKPGFKNQKMLASRVELDDYIKFEDIMYPQFGKRVKIQEVMNMFIRSCISGSIQRSGSLFTGGEAQ